MSRAEPMKEGLRCSALAAVYGGCGSDSFQYMSLSTWGRLSYISSTDSRDTWETDGKLKENSGISWLFALDSTNLKVPIDEPVGFKVVVVLTKRIDQLLSDLRPPTWEKAQEAPQHDEGLS